MTANSMLSDLIQAQPYPSRTADSAWSRAGQARDAIYDRFITACREAKVDALIHKSFDFEYPAWVMFKAWLPNQSNDATDRVQLVVLIEPKPQFQHEFVITIRAFRRGREKIYGPLADLSPDQLAPWVAYLLGTRDRPAYRRFLLRKYPFQLWRQRNKVRGIGTDWLLVATFGAVIVGIVASADWPGVGAIGFVIAAALGIIAWRRYPLYINAGRPEAEPRVLRLVDSWQTVIAGLGPVWPEIRKSLHARLRESNAPGIRSRLENISYLTPDGKQEREQVVLYLGRGIVFCHLYPYGDDLYVGWDAFMNYGTWDEAVIARAFARGLAKPVVIHDVKPASTKVTEYDLIDLNAVTEWTHTRIAALLKQVIAERKVDQEIDFQINRGERQSLLRDEQRDDARSASHGGSQPWTPHARRPRLSRTG